MTSGLRVHDLQTCTFIVSVVLPCNKLAGTNNLLCAERAIMLGLTTSKGAVVCVLHKVSYILMEREPSHPITHQNSYSIPSLLASRHRESSMLAVWGLHTTRRTHHHGTTVTHHHGTTAAHHHGTTAAHHHGTTAAHHHGTTVPHHHGTTVPCTTHEN